MIYPWIIGVWSRVIAYANRLTDEKGMRRLLAVNGIEKTSPGFRRKLLLIADKLELNADYLAAVISYESAATFSPSKENPASGAMGLIQFLPNTAVRLGTSKAGLAAMTAEQQLDYVEKFYAWQVKRFGKLESMQDHYTVVLAGTKFSGPDSVLFSKDKGKPCPPGSKSPSPPGVSCVYWQNRGLDTDGDGLITADNATAPIRAIVHNAEKKPPIMVDMAGPAATPIAAGGAVLFLVSLATWAVFFKGVRQGR